MFLDTQKITHEIRMKHWMQSKRKINQCIEKAPDLCYPFFHKSEALILYTDLFSAYVIVAMIKSTIINLSGFMVRRLVGN